MFIFARFHALPGNEKAAETALREAVTRTRTEPGCVSIHAYRSIRDEKLFYIYSEWVGEAAFERHAALPATVAFLDRIGQLIDHPLDPVTRAELMD